jgi:hypothetical protein
LDVPDQLEEKTISILTNDSGDGTHLIAVEATNFRDHVNLGEGLVTTLLDQARAALQWAAGDPDRREPYSFAPDNNGNPQQLRNYLTGMAEFGWNMYATLVAEKLDDEFERKLVESLAAPTTIQCARMGSSRLMYPWALVYDHPLIPDPGNQLCKEFLTAAGHGDPIEKTSCFNGNCPSKDDDNVVCPSGFWGFRHVIEQPLGEAESGDPVVATGNSDAVQVINVAGAADVFVGHNRDLDPQAAHVTAIQRLGGPNSSCASSLKDVGRGLQNHELHLVYFFCHGGSTDKNPRLGFGGETDEFLRAPDLKTWKVSWPNTHPLVFINGCETAAARPDDLALFHIHLRACKASGVIGTEIKVPVELAREVGTEILSRVVDERVSVGEAVRSMRLALLSRYNPLGLAYTPYCLAQLRMV